MFGDRIRSFAVGVAAVLALGLLGAPEAHAMFTVTNTGSLDFTNEASVAQPRQENTANFDRQSNPVLAVDKKIWDSTFTTDLTGTQIAIGTAVGYEITITYPKVVDSYDICGDDSAAQNIVFTDTIPTEITYQADSVEVSINGAAFVGKTDIADGDATVVTGSLMTVGAADITDMSEGDGDAACTPANTRRIRFQGTVNGL